MTPERWQQIEEILQAALDLPGDERAAFLDKACAGDDELRGEVEALLAREDSAEHFIETAAIKVVARGLAEADLSGQQISHYQILKPIGEGGMGKVYLVTDSKLNRNVAIKFLPEAFTANPERVRRFEQEAQAASKLNHPNIVTIHEFSQSGGRHFIVTEFIEGQTLREKLKESPPDIPQIINIALQVASALKAAHDANIIHRDIKPENIMLREDGVVKVLDFGIAKLQDRGTEGWGDRGSDGDLFTPSLDHSISQSLTQLGVVIGTASYMSPEQARGEEVDHRTDLFSLGAVLYEMVTRQRLFEGRTQAEVLRSLANNDESPKLESRLSNAPKELPKELVAIIRLALRKDRDKRYASAAAMLSDLQRLQESLKTQRLRRTMKYVAAGLAAALAIVLVAFWFARGEVWDEHKMNDGHIGHVRRAVFSPKGDNLVSIGEDQKVIVWDFASRKRLKTFTDHNGAVHSVAFSPNRKWFATGSQNNRLIVWDAERLEKIVELSGHQSEINSVVFSPDNRLLASSERSFTRTILWETQRWSKIREIEVDSGYANLLFSPDSLFLISGLGRWNLKSGQKATDYSDKFGWNWAEFSPDNKLFARTTSIGTVDFWELAQPGELSNHKVLGSFAAHQDYGRSVAFSPDGKLLASASENVALWETASRKLLARFESNSIVWSVAFSPDGRWLTSTHGDGSILVWDVADKRRAINFNGHGNAVRAITLSPDGKWLASSGDDRTIVLWNLQNDQKEMVLAEHKTRVTALAFSPDSQWLASYDQQGTLIRWDLATQQPIWKKVDSTVPGLSIVISPDGKRLITSQSVYESQTGQLILDLVKFPNVTAWSSATAISSDGQFVAFAGRSKEHIGLFLLNTKTWQVIAGQQTGSDAPTSISLSSDDRMLVTGGVDGKILLWQTKPFLLLGELGHHDARVNEVAFSPDGTEVISSSNDKKLKLWDVARRKLIRTIGDHSSPVDPIAFSRDGQFIVSGEHDHTVRIYRRHRTWFGKEVD